MYRELRNVLQYIISKLNSTDLASLYSLLSQEYEKILSAPSSDVDSQIVTLTQRIENALLDIEPEQFDNRSLQLFRKFDPEFLLGLLGLETFHQKIESIQNNPHGVSVTLAELGNKIKEIENKAQQALDSLAGIWKDEPDLETNDTEIQIVFDGNVAINDTHSLEREAKFWSDNIKLAHNMLADGKPDPQIVSMYKSSPSELILRGDWATLTMITLVFSTSLAVVEKILAIIEAGQKIQKTALEIKHLKRIEKEVEDGVEETLSKQIESSVKEIADQMSEFMPTGPEKNVALNAGRQLIANIYNFANDGGSISIVNEGPIPKETHVSDEIRHTIEKSNELQTRRQTLHNPVLPKALVTSHEKELTERAISIPKKRKPYKKRTTKKKVDETL